MTLTREQKATLVAELCITAYEKFKDYPEEAIEYIMGICGAEGIFRVPYKRTGLISERALKDKEETGKTPTPEHYFGRKESARKIFEQIAKGKDLTRIRNVVLSRSRVHLVTSKENNELKKHGDLPWRQAYAKCAIKLVEYEGRKIKKINISGKIFSSAKEVSMEYDLPINSVYQRLTGKIKKWSHWKYVE